jgi:hypothetical protein
MGPTSKEFMSEPLKPVKVLKPLIVADLENMVCADPNCKQAHDDLFINQACHIKGGVEIFYSKGTGIATVICFVCKRPVVKIGVALA